MSEPLRRASFVCAGEDDTPQQFQGVFSFDDGFELAFEKSLEADPPRLATRTV